MSSKTKTETLLSSLSLIKPSDKAMTSLLASNERLLKRMHLEASINNYLNKISLLRDSDKESYENEIKKNISYLFNVNFQKLDFSDYASLFEFYISYNSVLNYATSNLGVERGFIW